MAADNGVPLLRNMLVPYPGELSTQTAAMRVFNKLFSSARTFSEQAWGILVNRFRILYGTMGFKGPNFAARVYKVVRCTMLLHNILRYLGEPDVDDRSLSLESAPVPDAPQLGFPSGVAERDALAAWAAEHYTLTATGALRGRIQV